MSGKSVDLGAQLTYGGRHWPTWRWLRMLGERSSVRCRWTLRLRRWYSGPLSSRCPGCRRAGRRPFVYLAAVRALFTCDWAKRRLPMKRRGVLDDPSVRLVRVDVIEAWARHLYVMQNLPGYTTSVRRAILCECDDGRAAYVEYWRVGWRLWQ